MLPEIPIVSHFRYTCRYCLKNMHHLHVICLEFTGISPQILQGYPPQILQGNPLYFFWIKFSFFFFCLKMYISSFANLQNKSSKWILKKKVLLGVGLELVTLGTWVSHSPSLPPHLLWKNRKKYVFKVHCHYFNVD